MLAIRFLRQGRKNSAFFRVVLTESSRPPKSGFIKILGWYNPHTKEVKLEKDQITEALNNGAQASNSVAKLLNQNGIEHKNAKYVADAPKQKKGKQEESKPAAATQEDDSEPTETTEAADTKNEADVEASDANVPNEETEAQNDTSENTPAA